MDARKLSDAFEGIDEKYKMEADIFSETGKEPRRKGVLFPIFKGIVGAVAAVAVVVGLLWLGQLQQVPTGTGLKPGSAGETAAYTRLVFPERDDTEHLVEGTASLPPASGKQESSLEEQEIAALFRQEGPLTWCGKVLEEEFELSGEVSRGGRNELLSAAVGIRSKESENPEKLTVTANFAYDDYVENHPRTLRHPELVNFVGNAEVTTSYLVSPINDRVSFSYWEADFVLEGRRPIYVTVIANDMEAPSRTEELQDLISRCVGQILAGGVDLTVLNPLEPVAVEMAARYAEDIRTEFARNETGPELQECRYQDLKILAVRDDRESMVLALTLVIKPTDSVTTVGTWWNGNTRPGTGDLEGYVLADREVLLNKIDGVWQFGGDQTAGGITGNLGEEYQRMENPLGDQPTAE